MRLDPHALAFVVAVMATAPSPAPAEQFDEDVQVDEGGRSPWNTFMFADVGAGASSAGGEGAAIGLGEAVVMVTARPAPRIDLFSEIAVEPEEDGGAEVEVERLYLKYAFSGNLWARVGRFHTPLGYWNDAYGHGRIFFPSPKVPVLFETEHDGGVLPVHSVGASLTGRLRPAAGEVTWDLAVSNGRGARPANIQNTGDQDAAKALAGRLVLAPAAMPGLSAGVSALADRVPRDPADPARARPMAERIGGFFVRWDCRPIEAIAEAVRIMHLDRTARRTLATWGGYIEGRLRRSPWTPYVRAEALDARGDDPFRQPDIPDIARLALGTRYDLSEHVAVKSEVAAVGRTERAGARFRDRRGVEAAFQVAVGF